MEWKISLCRCRRFISHIIIHYGCHLSFIIVACAVSVAFLAALTVGGDTKTEQVEGNACHEITELRDLTRALANLSDWKSLGYELGVPHITVQSIENDEIGTENKRRAVLRAWYDLQDLNPCWQSVTDVLRQLGQNRLATRIDQCIHRIQSGTDCILAICINNGVDKCTSSYSISTTGVFITAVLVLIALTMGTCHCCFGYKSAKQGKEYRKHESQHHSRLCPEREQESTDAADIFSHLQDIRIMVSNYQLLQTIFSITDSECHSQEIKTSEQFSPIVTIVDIETQQTLNCVLLLHGEKCPGVSCRTLFCYIAVKVSYCDAQGSHHHPLYHMESKLCKEGKLPLIFCFHQPGTVCVIQLSIHFIVDSEGVEYMYHSEGCTCIVQIIDRVQQHGGVKLRDQHGVVRIKEPPLLTYTGPLTTPKYHKLESQFTKLFLSPNYKKIRKLSKQILAKSSISPDIKVFALCWKTLCEAIHKNYVHENYDKVLKTAWEKATQLECENGLLLQGRILRHLAHMYYAKGNDDKALEYISQAKEILSIAAPSNETAFALHTELRIKRRALFSILRTFSSEQYTSVEDEYELLLEHAKYMEEYEKPVVCHFFVMKASFYLRSDMITDKLQPEEYWPSADDLKKAEECLKRVSLDIMPSQSNFYTARYYRTLCDLHVWKREYSKAMYDLEKATEIHHQVKLEPRVQQLLRQRLKLLERLTGDEKIDEILNEY